MARIAQGPGGNPLRFSDRFKIHIEHLPTKNKVAFEGFVTSFSDNYTSQWNEQMVYGRMDPLSTFQSTRRTIEIGFDIPSDSKSHALENMYEVRRFIQFLYPTYNDSGLSQQNVLKAGPLLAIRWINLISSPNNDQEKLIGYINGGVSYSPTMDDGGFLAGRLSPETYGMAEDSRSKDVANYYPKMLSLSFSFTVLHTHLVGWAPDAEFAAAGVTSFVFGGDQAIASAFPNAAISPPPPPTSPGPENTEETTDDASATLASGEEAAPSEENQENAVEEKEEALNNTELTAGEKCAALGGRMAVRGDPGGGAVESYCNVPPAPGEDPKDGPCEGDRVRRHGPGTACRSPE